jgi:hypothetical protein
MAPQDEGVPVKIVDDYNAKMEKKAKSKDKDGEVPTPFIVQFWDETNSWNVLTLKSLRLMNEDDGECSLPLCCLVANRFGSVIVELDEMMQTQQKFKSSNTREKFQKYYKCVLFSSRSFINLAVSDAVTLFCSQDRYGQYSFG